MPIFKIDNDKDEAKQIFSDINYFESEAKLRDFFADNLGELLGMRFLAKEYPTTDGRIDTLALDENSSPVIIEYKWGEDNAVFVQGLFYFNWLKKNKKHFDLLVGDKFGKEEKVNWTNPRVILIARGFDNRTISAVQQVNNVELIKYMPYKQNIIYLENVYSPNKVKHIKDTKENKKDVDKEPLNLEYHFNKKNSTKEIRDIFYKLQEKIKSLPDIEEFINQKSGITYRTTMSFVRVEFGKTYIDVLLRGSKYNDPKKLVQDVSTFKWGYSGRTKIKKEKDIEDIFDLVKQSYQSTL